MGHRLRELECKEVVCVRDGCRLGFVTDVVVQVPEGCVKAIVVPGKGKLSGLLPGHDEYVIPWDDICRIGDDIILVDCSLPECRSPRHRPKWFAPV